MGSDDTSDVTAVGATEVEALGLLSIVEGNSDGFCGTDGVSDSLGGWGSQEEEPGLGGGLLTSSLEYNDCGPSTHKD